MESNSKVKANSPLGCSELPCQDTVDGGVGNDSQERQMAIARLAMLRDLGDAIETQLRDEAYRTHALGVSWRDVVVTSGLHPDTLSIDT